MGWTRRTAAATILQMTEAQQKEMGARVAQLRDARGMTNESLARKAGLSVKTVSRFVHGKHEPRTNTIEALALALEIPEREIRGTPPSPFEPVIEGVPEQLEGVDGKFTDLVDEVREQLDRVEGKIDRLMHLIDAALFVSPAPLEEQDGERRQPPETREEEIALGDALAAVFEAASPETQEVLREHLGPFQAPAQAEPGRARRQAG